MKYQGNWRLAAALIAGVLGLAGVAPARAQVNMREADPAVWLRQIYDLYHRAEKAPALQNQATDELVMKRASKSLAALFKKNRDCEKKAKGICALDWDFIVDGQDFTLSNIEVGSAAVAGDKATVTVKFRNFEDAEVNVYSFVREDGQWKVDDIETKQGSEAPVRISKVLRDYDYNQ
jgi:hypothetical protein